MNINRHPPWPVCVPLACNRFSEWAAEAAKPIARLLGRVRTTWEGSWDCKNPGGPGLRVCPGWINQGADSEGAASGEEQPRGNLNGPAGLAACASVVRTLHAWYVFATCSAVAFPALRLERLLQLVLQLVLLLQFRRTYNHDIMNGS